MIRKLETNVASGTEESPIDLETLLAEELVAADLAVFLLQRSPASFETAGLLADILVLRTEISEIRSHVCDSRCKVMIDPADDDYLVLHAIDERLKRVLRNREPLGTNIDQLTLLVRTVEKGFNIATALTAP